MRFHAIIIALNEEQFIREAIRPLYPHCSGISVITQYDRNYYGDRVKPDQTVQRVLDFDDPDGKISLIVRRYTDEAVSRNHEMMALLATPFRGVIPHHAESAALRERHAPPDYFLIVDADEIFDVDSVGNMFEYVAHRRPNICRIEGYEYAGKWNRRVPIATYRNVRVGFVKAGRYFCSRRVISLWELRFKKLIWIAGIPSTFADKLMGIDQCPLDIAAFHHGGLVRSSQGLVQRRDNHSEKKVYSFVGEFTTLVDQPCDYIPTDQLPRNIREATWPEGLIDRSEEKEK